MKKKLFFPTVFFVAFSFAAHAQLTTGKILAGGNLGVSSVTTNGETGGNTKSGYYNISPSFGFVYKTNRVIGFDVSYSHQTGANEGKSYGAAVYLRQYKPLGRILYVFAQERLAYSYLKSQQVIMFDPSFLTRTDRSNSVGLSLAPGFACDVTPHLQLELLLNSLVNLGYSNTKRTYSNTAYYQNSTDKQFALSSSFDLSQLSSINIGVRFLIGK